MKTDSCDGGASFMDNRPAFFVGSSGASSSQRSIQLTDEQQKRFWSKVLIEPNSGCWLWTAGCFGTGYGAFAVGRFNYGCHAIAFQLAGGILNDDKPCVLHSCNTRLCVNPAHLRAGTLAENVEDMVKINRNASGDRHGFRQHPEAVPRGSNHGMSKLTENQVKRIRLQYVPHRITTAMLAKKYRVSTATIRKIVEGHNWQHVYR